MHLRAGDPRGGRENLKDAIHATFTYIGIDIDGNPLPARRFTPVTEEDKRLWEHTQTLKDLRAQYEPEPLVPPADAVQRWSTDPRSRVPVLPRLDGEAPRCRQTRSRSFHRD